MSRREIVAHIGRYAKKHRNNPDAVGAVGIAMIQAATKLGEVS